MEGITYSDDFFFPWERRSGPVSAQGKVGGWVAATLFSPSALLFGTLWIALVLGQFLFLHSCRVEVSEKQWWWGQQSCYSFAALFVLWGAISLPFTRVENNKQKRGNCY